MSTTFTATNDIKNHLSNNESSGVNDFLFNQVSEFDIKITITVSRDIVQYLLDDAAKVQQKHLKAPGFDYGATPLDFLKTNYQAFLIEHIKEFLFKYYVTNTLYRGIRQHKLIIISDPKIVNICINENFDAIFQLDCIAIPNIVINEWRYLPFRPPKRKNYKDLDRQVEYFIAEELQSLEQAKLPEICENDWVALAIERTAEDGKPIFQDLAQVFWLQISDESVDNPLKNLLLGKSIGYSTLTQNKGLQDYFSEQFSTDYWYKLTILHRIPYAYFCFEQFKQHFKIKTKKELLKKLIEVFSYRNDISQRRSIVEECLKLLLNKHSFELPKSAITLFENSIMQSIHESPDYNVYRTQKEFKQLVQILAEKNARETALIDALVYHEDISISRDDICYYLNFTKRGRTKEFIYFEHPAPFIDGQKTLIPEEELIRYCIREKTLNHLIYYLTKE